MNLGMNQNYVLNSLQKLVPHYVFLGLTTMERWVENIFSSDPQMGIP
jgi:hypothetical protein